MSDLDLNDVVESFKKCAQVTDRTYRLVTYHDTFLGDETCQELVKQGVVADTAQALALGNMLMEEGVFHHVTRDHAFKNEPLFYRFAEVHGSSYIRSDKSKLSWADLLGKSQGRGAGLLPSLPETSGRDSSPEVFAEVPVWPLDEFNTGLLDRVRPPAWKNPKGDHRYNAVVIGAGAGGLVNAASIAGLGGRVALIEEHLLGGDCLNFGCVPSKALLRSARAVAQVRDASRFGVHAGDVKVDFGAIMARMRELRASISHHDSAERFAHELGVDVFQGRGTFVEPGVVEVQGTRLSYSKAIIATGASPAVPPIPGLKGTPYLTNLTVFNLTELPPRLGVIGGGVIGCELAQAFARFGSQVTLFQADYRLLPKEDDEAAQWVLRALTNDGVDVRLRSKATSVNYDQDSGFTIHTEQDRVQVDQLLIATGRRPNVDNMGLDKVGVELFGHGIKVDDRLQTTSPDIFAVGDVATPYQFTHVADTMARMVVRNAFFFGNERFSDLVIPWCTFTDPEVAHVGLYPRDLKERGVEFSTYRKDFSQTDRGLLEGSDGFVMIHTRKSGDEILGATIVGEHAGDMISEITVAMAAGLGLGAIAGVIHPYPTLAEAIRKCGDDYNRGRLTPTVARLLRGILSARR